MKAVRYDPTTIWLHWMTAGLIGILWIIGQTADWAPRGSIRNDVWSIHVLLGFVIALILVLRIAWRFHFGRVLPPPDTGIVYALAKVTQYSLYALLIIAVGLGVTTAAYRGYWPLPHIGIGDSAMRHATKDWHGLASNLILLVAGLHALAALAHQYILRDRLIERMIPRSLASRIFSGGAPHG